MSDCACREESAHLHLFASHPEQQFCRSHQAIRSFKLTECLSHLLQQLLLLLLAELPHHTGGQPACCRLQKSIERRVMGRKWNSSGDDVMKAGFFEFLFKDRRI